MRSVRIKQLQEFLKSDHWLRIYCILSGGVFYFEPPCTNSVPSVLLDGNEEWQFACEDIKVSFETSDGPADNDGTLILSLQWTIKCMRIAAIFLQVLYTTNTKYHMHAVSTHHSQQSPS